MLEEEKRAANVRGNRIDYYVISACSEYNVIIAALDRRPHKYEYDQSVRPAVSLHDGVRSDVEAIGEV